MSEISIEKFWFLPQPVEIIWDDETLARYYLNTWGHPIGTPEPPTHAVLRKVEEDFVQAIESQGKAVIRQVVIEGAKAKLDKKYFQYLFYLIVEEHTSWSMPKEERSALRIGRDIMTNSGDLPRYRQGMQIPPYEDEVKVAAALYNIARWCRGPLAGILIMAHLECCEKHKKEYGKLRPEFDKDHVLGVLMGHFDRAMKNLPGIFYTPPSLALRVIDHLL